MEIRTKLERGNYDERIKALIDEYVKSFEVRKRIYTGYDGNWKPLPGAGFEDYGSYLLLADCLLWMYQHTRCLKYFSCLLKLDDTLLSVENKLGSRQKEHLGSIIRQELGIFGHLAEEEGIKKGAAE